MSSKRLMNQRNAMSRNMEGGHALVSNKVKMIWYSHAMRKKVEENLTRDREMLDDKYDENSGIGLSFKCIKNPKDDHGIGIRYELGFGGIPSSNTMKGVNGESIVLGFRGEERMVSAIWNFAKYAARSEFIQIRLENVGIEHASQKLYLLVNSALSGDREKLYKII